MRDIITITTLARACRCRASAKGGLAVLTRQINAGIGAEPDTITLICQVKILVGRTTFDAERGICAKLNDPTVSIAIVARARLTCTLDFAQYVSSSIESTINKEPSSRALFTLKTSL